MIHVEAEVHEGEESELVWGSRDSWHSQDDSNSQSSPEAVHPAVSSSAIRPISVFVSEKEGITTVEVEALEGAAVARSRQQQGLSLEPVHTVEWDDSTMLSQDSAVFERGQSKLVFGRRHHHHHHTGSLSLSGIVRFFRGGWKRRNKGDRQFVAFERLPDDEWDFAAKELSVTDSSLFLGTKSQIGEPRATSIAKAAQKIQTEEHTTDSSSVESDRDWSSNRNKHKDRLSTHPQQVINPCGHMEMESVPTTGEVTNFADFHEAPFLDDLEKTTDATAFEAAVCDNKNATLSLAEHSFGMQAPMSSSSTRKTEATIVSGFDNLLFDEAWGADEVGCAKEPIPPDFSDPDLDLDCMRDDPSEAASTESSRRWREAEKQQNELLQMTHLLGDSMDEDEKWNTAAIFAETGIGVQAEDPIDECYTSTLGSTREHPSLLLRHCRNRNSSKNLYHNDPPFDSALAEVTDESLTRTDPMQRATYLLLSAAVIPIQATMRKFLARRELVLRMYAMYVIQQAIYCWLVRLDYLRKRSAAVVIQSEVRRCDARQVAVLRMFATFVLQSAFRTCLLRRAFLYHRAAAVMIQAVFRGGRVRDQVFLDHWCASEIQRFVRGWLATIEVYGRIYKITIVQSVARRNMAISRATDRMVCVIQIQSVVRGFLCRDRMARFNLFALKIQSRWRSFHLRLTYQFNLLDIIIVQSICRRWLAKQGFETHLSQCPSWKRRLRPIHGVQF